MQLAFGIDLNISDAWGYWFSGWIDGEGCFTSHVHKRGKAISVWLNVGVRQDEKPLIQEVKDIFKCGYITEFLIKPLGSPSIQWRVFDINEQRFIILPILDKYPLRSKKKTEYEIYRELVILLQAREHLHDKYSHCLELVQQLSKAKKYSF